MFGRRFTAVGSAPGEAGAVVVVVESMGERLAAAGGGAPNDEGAVENEELALKG